MATRKERAKLVKVTLNLFDSDWQYLKSVYTKSGASKTVRKLVEAHARKVKERLKSSQEDVKRAAELVEIEG